MTIKKRIFLLIFISFYFIHAHAMRSLVSNHYQQDGYRACKNGVAAKFIVRPSGKKRVRIAQADAIEASFIPLLKQSIFTVSSLCCSSSSWEEAARMINALVQTNKYLKMVIDDSQRSLRLIKDISIQFNRSNEDVALALCTEQAKIRYAVQMGFYRFCQGISLNDEEIIANTMPVADVNFTYGVEHTTPLMIVCGRNNGLVEWAVPALISKHADITLSTRQGKNAFMFALEVFNKKAINFFLVHPLLTSAFLNQTDSGGKTALHYCIKGLWYSGHQLCYDEDGTRSLFAAGVVTKLLSKGAKSNVLAEGKTPLLLAREWGADSIIEILEKWQDDSIAKQ